MRRQAILLFLTSLVGIGVFLLTDPEFVALRLHRDIGNTNAVDAARIARPGTIIGVTGCGMCGLIGLWLTLRRLG